MRLWSEDISWKLCVHTDVVVLIDEFTNLFKLFEKVVLKYFNNLICFFANGHTSRTWVLQLDFIGCTISRIKCSGRGLKRFVWLFIGNLTGKVILVWILLRFPSLIVRKQLILSNRIIVLDWILSFWMGIEITMAWSALISSVGMCMEIIERVWTKTSILQVLRHI